MRIDAEPAAVLHTRPYKEASQLVDLFTRHHGVVRLVAKGARRTGASSLQPFNLLNVGYTGRHALKTLIGAEVEQPGLILTGRPLYCAFYVNELLLKATKPEQPYPDLFDHYWRTLARLAQHHLQPGLRDFEVALLQACGHWPDLTEDENGQPVAAASRYRLLTHHDWVALRPSTDDDPSAFSGASLVAIAQQHWQQPQVLHDAKRLMRALVDQLLQGQPLNSRQLFAKFEQGR